MDEKSLKKAAQSFAKEEARMKAPWRRHTKRGQCKKGENRRTKPWKRGVDRGGMRVAILILALLSLGMDFERLADSIYRAEGAEKAKKPFGILSIPCEGYEECRQICLNTLKNNFKRWEASSKKKPYLEFLAERYAPRKAHPLNTNWLKNVRYFYNKNLVDKQYNKGRIKI